MINKLNSFNKQNITKLTNNEKILIKTLLENSRTPDIEIGKNLNISAQAVGKIKRKLETNKVINNHLVEINPSRVGINTYALALLNLDPSQIDEIKSNNLITLCKVLQNGINHIAIYGFKDLNSLGIYFDKLRSKNLGVKKTYIFPQKNLLKHTQKDLFIKSIKEFGENNPYFALSQNDESKNKENNKILTNNEKVVLKKLIEKSNISDRKLTRILNSQETDLTNCGVSKIKKRLEKNGIIERYTLNLNHKILGINMLAFIFLKNIQENSNLQDKRKGIDNIMGFYNLNEESLSVMLCGFKDLHELENLCDEMKTEQNKIFDIKKIYLGSTEGIIKNSFSDLLISSLD